MLIQLFYEDTEGKFYVLKNNEYYQLNFRAFGGGGRGPRGPEGPAGPAGDNAPSYQATATNDITTSSTTDVVATGMTLTPPAGTYLVWFSGSVSTSYQNASEIVSMSIYYNNSQIQSSEVSAFSIDSNLLNPYSPFTSIAKITTDGTNSIEGRWRTSNAADISTMYQRNLTILKVA